MKKVVLITGAAKGIGFEVAKQMGKKDFTVVASARNQEKVEQTVFKLKNEGVDVYGIKLDVNNDKDISELESFISTKFGKLDVLINNAGVQMDLPGFMPSNSTETVSKDVLKQTFDTNFFAPITITQKLLPLLKKSEKGRIVNVSSIMGSLTLHSDSASPIFDIKLLAYNSSKTALNQFTLHLAHALKDTKIKVNSAHPGWVKTDLGGEYAPMTIEEGAKTIVNLSMLDEDGINGGFVHLQDSLPW